MKSRLTWRNLLIAFLLLLGVSGVIEALPHASETTGDLLIDAGILVLIVAISAVLANSRLARIKRRKP